jgi:pectin methylesterase-like acyl-CoA thioesterase
MRLHQKPAAFLGLFLATAVPSLATTVFNDTFNGGSTINNATPTPATPSLGATAYQQISAKAFQTTSVASGHMKYGLPATTSAVNMVEALFSQYPVVLTNNADYIQLSVTFTAQNPMLDGASSFLFFGLYNAGQVQPKPGGLANATTGSAGNAQNWQGYVSRIASSVSPAVNHQIVDRKAQTSATAANNQDVTYSYNTPASVAVGTSAASTLAALTTAQQYTGVFTITKTGEAVLQIVSSLYTGTDTSATPLFTQTASSTSILTNSYDALSFGFRATGVTGSTHVQIMDVNSVKIVTNAATTILPVIESPPIGQTRSIGENVAISVVANGGGAAPLSYRWYKNDVEITLAENPTAQSQTLSFPSAQLPDTGNYKVSITNTAGTVTSTPVLLTITDGPIPPAIVTNPTGATILVGGSKSFSVLAYGTATLAYQWEFSNDGGTFYTPINLATGTSYDITSAVLTDAGRYRCVISNGVGSPATSAAAILVVNEAPQISQQPVGGTLNPGDPLTLSVTATGTPAPTYQWKKNGVNIAGATNPTYSVGSVTGADTGSYTVVVTNSVNSVTSAAASVAVVSPTLATSAFAPANTAGNRNPDTRLAITFNAPVTAGVSGFLRIHDASDNSVVDTIDFAATTLRNSLRAVSLTSTLNLPVQNQSIGGVTNFNYYPLTISGNTVTIYPRNGALTYNKSYYVKIEAGAFVNAAGESFSGISDTTTWTFGTKAVGPAPGAGSLIVASNGTGDFDTVQGALDWVPSGNTDPRSILIRNGSYFEQVVFTNKHFLTLQGEDRAQTTIVYPNNNNFNNVSGFYHRSTFIASNVHDINVVNLKFNNTTPQGGSQAESFIISGSSVFGGRNIVTKCNFYSFQDTIQINRQCYISDCYIEGDTDFMWGSGPCFFSNCDIRMLRSNAYFSQVRNDIGNHGYVYSNCRFTAASGFTGNFLNRIDPRSTGFPYSEMVLLNCKIGDATNNAFLNTSVGANGSDFRGGWWLLNGTNTPATDALNIHNWDYNTTDANGAPLTFANRPAFTVMPTDPTTLANYSDPFWVLNTTWGGVVTGTWTPSLPVSFLTQPQSQSVAVGAAVSFTVDVVAVPGPTYQWYLNNVAISGATASSYPIAAAGGADWGVYKVVATSAGVSVTSNSVSLTPVGAPISNPSADTDNDGFNDLMEYSFATDPASGASNSITYAAGVVSAPGQPVVIVPNASEFHAVFGRRKNYLSAGLLYTVQFSATLGVWVDSNAIPSVVATGAAIDAVSVPFPATITTENGEEQPKFFRVRITSN